MIEIYWGSGSPFAWRVLLALEIKGLSYRSNLIEFSKRQHKTPEFLALNPRGKVPVLRDGAFVLSESLAILAYLDRKSPEPPLFGRNAEETGRVWHSISETISYLEPVAYKIVAPIFFDRTEKSADEIRAAVEPLQAEVAGLERKLENAPWLGGERISAADVVAHPVIEMLLRAAANESAKPFDLGLAPLNDHYPRLAAWRDRIRSLPGYERTSPPHWRASA
jgi:glutathione S-transferase